MPTWKTSIYRSTYPRRRCSPGYVFALHPNPTGQATETIQLDYAQRPFGSAADRSLPSPFFLPPSLLQLHGMRDGNINLDNFFSVPLSLLTSNFPIGPAFFCIFSLSTSTSL